MNMFGELSRSSLSQSALGHHFIEFGCRLKTIDTSLIMHSDLLTFRWRHLMLLRAGSLPSIPVGWARGGLTRNGIHFPVGS